MLLRQLCDQDGWNNFYCSTGNASPRSFHGRTASGADPAGLEEIVEQTRKPSVFLEQADRSLSVGNAK